MKYIIIITNPGESNTYNEVLQQIAGKITIKQDELLTMAWINNQICSLGHLKFEPEDVVHVVIPLNRNYNQRIGNYLQTLSMANLAAINKIFVKLAAAGITTHNDVLLTIHN